MALFFIKPNKFLAPYIDRYWIFDNNDNPSSFMSKIPPGVGIDLFIHYTEPFQIGNGEKMPHSHLIFSGQNACQISASGRVHFIAIRFKAGAFKNFTDIPLTQLRETYASTENIWGISGKHFMTRINSIEEKDATVSQLELFLERKLKENKKDTPAWDFIVDNLYRYHDSITIDSLSGKANMSNRHFRRKFAEETGFSPKHFQQLSRFHSAIKPLLLNKEKTYLPTVIEKVYFDQNHFIKEFKNFMNCTPSNFLQDKTFMSHFYYPALKIKVIL